MSGCTGVASGCVEKSSSLVHCRPVRTGHEVPVSVYRQLDGCMSELLLYVSGRFLLSQEKGRIGVPQIVESNLPQSCFFETLVNKREFLAF